MALTRTELESITRSYFIADKGAAFDQFFGSNYLLRKGMKKPLRKPSGGREIKIPLSYDRMLGGSFYGADQLDTSHQTIMNSAIFNWRNYYINVTITWDEELENNGPEEEVDMVVSKLGAGQRSMEEDQADGLYSDGTGNSSKDLDGLLALFNTTSATKYGDIAEDDMSVWNPLTSSTSTPITSAALRAGRTSAKIGDGIKDKPDMIIMYDTIVDAWLNQLQAAQRMESPQAAKAGFSGVHMLDQAEVWADGKCPSAAGFWLNSRHWGFVIHKKANYVRTPWKVPTNQVTKSMQYLWKGNMVCTRRNAHYYMSALTA
jgi:hypothetical protein